MVVNSFVEERATVQGWNLIVDSNWIYEYKHFNPEVLSLFNTSIGTVVEFQKVKFSQIIEKVPGYDGLLVDAIARATKETLESQTMVLRKRKGQLCWVPVND